MARSRWPRHALTSTCWPRPPREEPRSTWMTPVWVCTALAWTSPAVSHAPTVYYSGDTEQVIFVLPMVNTLICKTKQCIKYVSNGIIWFSVWMIRSKFSRSLPSVLVFADVFAVASHVSDICPLWDLVNPRYFLHCACFGVLSDSRTWPFLR